MVICTWKYKYIGWQIIVSWQGNLDWHANLGWHGNLVCIRLTWYVKATFLVIKGLNDKTLSR